jgi:hypothetical protein
MFNRSAANPTGNTGNAGGAANGTMNRRALTVSVLFYNTIRCDTKQLLVVT